MDDWVDEIKDAWDLRKHLINTRNFKFVSNLPNVELLVWKQSDLNPHLNRFEDFL